MRKLIKAADQSVNNLRKLRVGDMVSDIFDGTDAWEATIAEIHITYDLDGKANAYLEYTLKNMSSGKEFKESNAAEAFYRNYVLNK